MSFGWTGRRGAVLVLAAAVLLAASVLALPARTATGAPASAATPSAPSTDPCPAAGEGAPAVVRYLYIQLLNRCPDTAGEGYWVDELLVHGVTPGAVANALCSSTEFLTRLVNYDYNRYLSRAPTADELHFWEAFVRSTGHLGTIEVSLLLTRSAAGSWSDAEFVSGAYQFLLDRPPDTAGNSYWTSALAAGVSRQQVAEALVNGAERATGLVYAAYVDLLRRNPDTDGLMYWTSWQLQHHAFFGLLAALANTSELVALANTNPPLD